MLSACFIASVALRLPAGLSQSIYPSGPGLDKSSSSSMSPSANMRQRRSAMRANYHPFLFTLMTLTAAAELGLTAFLISAGNESGHWTSPSYHSLSVPRPSRCRQRLTESHLHNSLILLCFSSAWTLLFSTAYVLWIFDGAVHLLAQVASSAIWLLLTSVLWVR